MNNLIPQKHYKDFLNEVIVAVKNSQYKAYQAVNRQLVELYWAIGKQLHEKIEVAKWGEGIVEKLSLDLQREFPGMTGFSKENVWRMKKLYETYSPYEKLSPLVTELAWSKNIIILNQAKDMGRRQVDSLTREIAT